MAKAYIREYQFMGASAYEQSPIQREPAVVDQVVDFTSGETQSQAFGSSTRYVTVNVDATCSYAVGQNPTATTANMRAVKDQTFSFGVSPGQKASFVQNT